MTDFTFSSTHEFYFSTREPVPIAQVAESLLALERVVKFAPKVLEGLTQVEILGVDVYVDAIESGSLLEKVVIRLLFKNEETLDAFLDRIGEHIRKPGMPRSVLIGTILAALVGYGAWLAAKVGNPAGQTTITANNNTIINLGAGQVDLTPEAFRAIVAAAVTDKKDLAQNAVKIFHAARDDSQASIVIDGNQSTSFSPDVISATPKKVEIEKQEKVEHLRDVDLQIRATDLDSLSRGWAAVIPGKIDRRVRLKLDPGIKPSEVADKFSVRADVSIHYQLDRAGKKLVPNYILLREVIKD
ncbi:MAG: hypothetical protein C0466_07685 [Candidatus Accumulibacter sp.]|nr:hypothetical protein [Accumulibacter sp.]